MARVAFVGATVLDGIGPRREGETVVVEDDRITAVGRGVPIDGCLVVESGGMTVMPGIVDAHVHFAPWAQWLVSQTDDRLMRLASETVHAMRLAVEAGVTTACDLGGLEAGFVEAQSNGLIAAPRLQTSVVIIQPVNGLLDGIPGRGGTTSRLGQMITVPGMPSPYASGPWAAREKVREVVRAGAGVIKLTTAGQRIQGEMHWEQPSFHEEEITAIIDEAHRFGLRATAHARGAAGIAAAVRAGIDGIEHGGPCTDEVLEEMAARGVWMMPTLWITKHHATTNPRKEDRDNAVRRGEATADALRRAHAIGVPIALGSDGGYHGPDAGLIEMVLMAEAGIPALDVVRAATSRAAQWLGIPDVGTVAAGKKADLLLVDGDPLVDLGVLQRATALVVQDGSVVGGRMRHEISARLALQAAKEGSPR